MPYEPRIAEPKWQARWEREHAFATDTDASKPKAFILDMFPYPSGAGLHVGHCEGYTATDVLARFKRARGFRVLHPMGWDAFGLPAENYAIKHGVHPRATTEQNVANFRRQIKMLGKSIDWSREIDTTDPAYYKWTQWIFLQLFERGLAYEATVPINWCPSCRTGLANEEVKQGRCDRCGTLVERRDMRQWILRITAYADRLLADLDGLDWPEGTLTMQRDWIGRSEGAEVTFAVADADEPIVVFTTRPDTLYGATYVVLAPEHPLVEKVTTRAQRDAVNAYVAEAKGKSDRERTEVRARRKTGVFTGAFAVNPVNGARVPIWTADYVLWGYGTGAIMAVPAHDERDWDFAQVFALPIVQVVAAKGGSGGEAPATAAFIEQGEDAVLINSGEHSGLSASAGKRAIVAALEQRGLAKPKVGYKLRDWVFSRQRYWGEPIPIVHCPEHGAVAVPEAQLPVRLPDVERYEPTGTGESPLATIESWVNTTCPACGKPARRETNTMPQWAGSCWYYLRYLDPHNEHEPFSAQAEKDWMPVDMYIGGAEHAVLHLLYARFWHKVLYDIGRVHTVEPFKALRHQGMVLGEAELTTYRDAAGEPVSSRRVELEEQELEDRTAIVAFDKKSRAPLTIEKLAPDAVEKKGGDFVLKGRPDVVVDARAHKMSKSRGNVVNPDDVVAEHGADALRLYEMFMGDFESSKPWDARAIMGVVRFLANVWKLVEDPKAPEGGGDPHEQLRHRTIRAVTERIESLKFNTAIAAMMEFINALGAKGATRADVEALVQLVAPYAPHMAEEAWERLGHDTLVCRAPWPTFDPALTVTATVTVPVQVSGKTRGTVEMPRGATEQAVREEAMKLASVTKALEGRTEVRVVFIPDRMLNIVVK